MATGHVLPGYGDPVSSLRRVQSAGYPLDKRTLLDIAQSTRLHQEEMLAIRNNAKRLWGARRQPTTYDSFFAERPADEMIGLRPTSPTRRNNPHPTPVFLTNRLHHVPGLHNADVTIGKDAYRVDASVPAEERGHRLCVREKYSSRVDPAGTSAFRDPTGLRQQLDGRSAQAAEAWLKIADDQDRENVMNAVQKFRDDEQTSQEESMAKSGRTRSAQPSLHRWMRYAGAKEADSVNRIVTTIQSDPDARGNATPNPFHPRQVLAPTPHPNGPGLLSMRRRDIANAANARVQSRPSRGDFSIHPDWPPIIPHHRVP